MSLLTFILAVGETKAFDFERVIYAGVRGGIIGGIAGFLWWVVKKLTGQGNRASRNDNPTSGDGPPGFNG
jgi:hypothetical protein